MNCNLTPEAAALFQEGINLMLSRWAALRMAVENERGGRASGEKTQQLSENLFNLFTQSKEKAMVMHEECLEGNFNLIKRLQQTSIPSISYKRQPNGDNEDGSEDDDGDQEENNYSKMEVDAPLPQSRLSQYVTVNEPTLTQRGAPVVEDGWTLVSGRSRGRNN